MQDLKILAKFASRYVSHKNKTLLCSKCVIWKLNFLTLICLRHFLTDHTLNRQRITISFIMTNLCSINLFENLPP